MKATHVAAAPALNAIHIEPVQVTELRTVVTQIEPAVPEKFVLELDRAEAPFLVDVMRVVGGAQSSRRKIADEILSGLSRAGARQSPSASGTFRPADLTVEFGGVRFK